MLKSGVAGVVFVLRTVVVLHACMSVYHCGIAIFAVTFVLLTTAVLSQFGTECVIVVTRLVLLVLRPV